MNNRIVDILSLIECRQFETKLRAKGYRAICGVDECGRGPLAGPVVAAAVIFPPDLHIKGLDDSKKLTPLARERIFEEIAQLGLICAIGIIDHESIDRLNIHRASLAAMAKAVMDLKQAPDFCLVDGKFTIPNLSIPQTAVIEGDSICPSISAASVIAKMQPVKIYQIT